MNKSVLWKQVQMILDNLSVLINRVASVVKKPTGKHQMLVTDAKGESKWEERTHWTESGEAIILDNAELEFVQGPNAFFIGEPLGLEVGEKYKVIWNGTEYVCTAVETTFDGIQCVAVGDVNGGSKEPFVVLEPPHGAIGTSDICAIVFPADPVVRLIITIKHVTGTVKKLDPKYLYNADWNAKKEEAGYIENKPFEENVFIENEVFTTDEEWGDAELSAEFNPIAGKTYTVVYDSETYQCVAFENFNAVCIGNAKIIDPNDGIDTGEPFAIINGFIVTNSFGEKHTVSITELRKLDPKYLPDGIGGGADWNAKEGEAGYIANRTHWAVESVDDILVDPELKNLSGYFGIRTPFSLTVGEKYIVLWNGVQYECIAKEVPAEYEIAAIIGNTSGYGGEDTGEPFNIAYVDDEASHAQGFYGMAEPMPWNNGRAIELTVKHVASYVKKLDPKYLPDGIGGGAEVRQLAITQMMDALVYFDTGEMPDSQTAIDILSKRPTLRVRGNNGEDLGGMVIPAMIERDEDVKMISVMIVQPGDNGGVQSVALPLMCSDSVV